MESVGIKLRNERLRQGLSLDALSAKTRIPVKSLKAIEDDHHSQISPTFFYKSFVRQFAENLGMRYNDLAPAVNSVLSGVPEPPLPHANDDPMLPKIAPLQPMRPKKYRWLFSMVALITVLFACSGLYAMWEDSRDSAEKAVSQQQQSPEIHAKISELRRNDSATQAR